MSIIHTNPFDEFRALLRTRLKTYSQTYKEFEKRPGQKLIKLRTDFILDHLEHDDAVKLFDHIFNQLPKDAVIMDIEENLIFLMPSFTSDGNGSWHDCYGLIVCSSEWPRITGGNLIPELVLKGVSK